jgi:hypothetical protein
MHNCIKFAILTKEATEKHFFFSIRKQSLSDSKDIKKGQPNRLWGTPTVSVNSSKYKITQNSLTNSPGKDHYNKHKKMMGPLSPHSWQFGPAASSTLGSNGPLYPVPCVRDSIVVLLALPVQFYMMDLVNVRKNTGLAL